jgi:RNA polymerase sigma factor (sigma-70 family)
MDEQTDNLTLYAACYQDGSDAQADAFTVLGSHIYTIARAMLQRRPDGEALAQDCAQLALIKIHRNLGQCHFPGAFREWAAQVVRRVVIDELRRPDVRRRVSIPDDEDHVPWLASEELLTNTVDVLTLLREVVARAPLSDRSRRVVAGRYFEEQTDEVLAEAESTLAGQQVLPSHIQVTRAKNLSTLRRDVALLNRLRDLVTP